MCQRLPTRQADLKEREGREGKGGEVGKGGVKGRVGVKGREGFLLKGGV